jgi:hypothetical protein
MVEVGKSLVDVLQEISNGPDLPSADDLKSAWETLANALGLGPNEVNRPFCECSETIREAGYDAQAVVVDFRTPVPLAKMKAYTDPRIWPTCSTFFRAMELQGKLDYQAGSATDWNATFEEIIDVVPGLTLINPLAFRYRETSTAARSDYKLVVPTEHILVDEGFIDVREDTTSGSFPPGSAVTVVKVIRFVDPAVQMWPSFACDLFWGELSLDMAMQCSSGV